MTHQELVSQTQTFTTPTEIEAHGNILRPLTTVENIISTYREYNFLKEKLLIDSDYQTIKGKKCIKKSWLRKLATAFGISTEITHENRVNVGDYFIYEITVRAISPSGRYAEACASCASNERDFNHLENDVRATWQTRATNRAIADLIGSGEVSADEMDDTSTETLPDTEDLEQSEPHIKWFVHKNNTFYEGAELMTVKQKSLLIKLIETKYKDESSRAKLFNRLHTLTKVEARSAIQKMLA